MSDHQWEAYPEGAPDFLLRGLADMCGLEREEDGVREFSSCNECSWTRIRHTYGVIFVRDTVIQDKEPACEPGPEPSAEFQAAIDALKSTHQT